MATVLLDLVLKVISPKQENNSTMRTSAITFKKEKWLHDFYNIEHGSLRFKSKDYNSLTIFYKNFISQFLTYLTHTCEDWTQDYSF